MSKSLAGNCRSIPICRFIFLIFTSLILYFVTFVSVDFSTLSTGNIASFTTFLFHNFANPTISHKPESPFDHSSRNFSTQTSSNDATTWSNNEFDSEILPLVAFNAIKNVTEIHKQDDPHPGSECSGRYIYVYDLPSQFNEDLLKNCDSLIRWFNLCPYLSNMGFGPRVDCKYNSKGVLPKNKSWFKTNQFSLEVIFHNRMKHYKCLTNDSSLASAVFVPFYAGLDLGRFLWGFNTSVRDALSENLVNWLKERPEWRRMWGRDHFLVGGRVSWDFRRETEKESEWGSKLMFLPESKNMTMLSIETSLWTNDFAIPYPTYFHPSNDNEVFAWQRTMRKRKKPYLFSFVGAPRPDSEESIRGEIIKQCQSSKKLCKFLDCNDGGTNCDEPANVMKVFERSVFCLQPSGDSYTRRSTFDSILAGCVPVFFNPGSCFKQYLWHFPKNYTQYSVFIPENEVREKKISIGETLLKVPKDEVLAMREEAIRLIPSIVFANPTSSLKTLEDAFDIAVKGVLERVRKVRKAIEDGKDPGIGFAELNTKRLEM